MTKKTESNRIIRIYFIQEYTLEKQKLGISKTRIWRNINYVFPISRAAYYRFLSVNARAQLKGHGLRIEELAERRKYFISIIPN